MGNFPKLCLFQTGADFTRYVWNEREDGSALVLIVSLQACPEGPMCYLDFEQASVGQDGRTTKRV